MSKQRQHFTYQLARFRKISKITDFELSIDLVLVGLATNGEQICTQYDPINTLQKTGTYSMHIWPNDNNPKFSTFHFMMLTLTIFNKKFFVGIRG